MKLKDSVELLKLYFKNKASQGAVTLNGNCVLAAFEDVISKKPTANIYQNVHDNYMIGVVCPLFDTREQAEDWALENGFKLSKITRV